MPGRSPRRLPVAMVSLMLTGAVLVAGCQPSNPPTAVGAMRTFVSEFNDGFGAQWDSLVAGQQSLIPQADYVLCNEEAYSGALPGKAPFRATYDNTVATKTEQLPVPGVAHLMLPATVVTARAHIGATARTITLAWFFLGGVWRWALPPTDHASAEAELCPPPPTTGSPFAPPPVAPTTTTTTVPLIAPANVKLQVVNGLLVGSLAGQFSAKLHAKPGYTTLPPEDATSKVQLSAIYILTPGYAPEADALARAVGLPASSVVTTVPPPSSAPIPNVTGSKANLVLVIGGDLAAAA